MTGYVDSAGRALLPIRLQHPVTKTETDLEVWIDTGFTGDLVLPAQLIASLGFPISTQVMATLADGSVVKLDTYTCSLDWLGQWKSVELVANQGEIPLLGAGLLKTHNLHIDYVRKTIVIT